MFSAYLLDPEHGWHSRTGLSLSDAVRLCKDFRNDWAGSIVAVVPDGADPHRYLQFAQAIVGKQKLTVVETQVYHQWDPL